MIVFQLLGMRIVEETAIYFGYVESASTHRYLAVETAQAHQSLRKFGEDTIVVGAADLEGDDEMPRKHTAFTVVTDPSVNDYLDIDARWDKVLEALDDNGIPLTISAQTLGHHVLDYFVTEITEHLEDRTLLPMTLKARNPLPPT